MITTVVFDADETLVDLRPAVRGGLVAVLEELRRRTPAAAAVSLADLESDWVAVFPELRSRPVAEIRRAALARSVARVGLTGSLDAIAELFFARRFALTRPYDEVPAVLARAGCAPDAVVHVGDLWEHDVVAARAAGLRAVWLNRAGAPLPAAGVADAEIRTLTALPATVAQLSTGLSTGLSME